MRVTYIQIHYHNKIFIISFPISFRLRFFLISGAVILGPRIDRFRDTNSKYIAGHSIPLISLGGFILIFGFMAFNAGSQVYSQKRASNL